MFLLFLLLWRFPPSRDKSPEQAIASEARDRKGSNACGAEACARGRAAGQEANVLTPAPLSSHWRRNTIVTTRKGTSRSARGRQNLLHSQGAYGAKEHTLTLASAAHTPRLRACCTRGESTVRRRRGALQGAEPQRGSGSLISTGGRCAGASVALPASAAASTGASRQGPSREQGNGGRRLRLLTHASRQAWRVAAPASAQLPSRRQPSHVPRATSPAILPEHHHDPRCRV